MDLKTVSVEALSSVLTFVKQSGEFVKEQAPMLAQEIVKYELVSSVAAVILSLVGLIFSLVMIKKSLKSECEGIQLFGSIIHGLIIFSCVIITCDNSMKFVKAYTAPRLVIIEKISELIK